MLPKEIELRVTNTPYEHVSTYQNFMVLDFLCYQYARFKVAGDGVGEWLP
jgi:hypothetical protein